MKNYISINNQKIELTDEQVKLIMEAQKEDKTIMLADVPVGEVVKIGGYELIVLEQIEGTTALICKDLIGEDSQFGESNNYNGSYVDEICNSFSGAIADAVGDDNIVTHTVDLTADDGLKDYGQVERRASLLTADLYRRHVEILDKFKPTRWWWLATPFSTKRHDDDDWVKCVSPSGYFICNRCCCSYDCLGVRPFCILKSNIFVSKEE